MVALSKSSFLLNHAFPRRRFDFNRADMAMCGATYGPSQNWSNMQIIMLQRKLHSSIVLRSGGTRTTNYIIIFPYIKPKAQITRQHFPAQSIASHWFRYFECGWCLTWWTWKCVFSWLWMPLGITFGMVCKGRSITINIIRTWWEAFCVIMLVLKNIHNSPYSHRVQAAALLICVCVCEFIWM